MSVVFAGGAGTLSSSIEGIESLGHVPAVNFRQLLHEPGGGE